MKNFLTTCLILSAPTLAAFGQTRDLPTIELQPLKGAELTTRGLPSFDGIAFGPAANAEALASRLLEAAGVREPKGLTKLTATADGSKLRLQGSAHPSTCLEITPLTGDISFQTDVKGMNLEASTPGLPAGQNAVRRALQHLRATGLLPGNVREMFVQHVGGLRMAALDGSGKTTEFAKVTSVHFGRRIGGVNVSGPGSKIIVHLGEQGRLVGVTRRWMELEMQAHSAKDLLRANEVSSEVTRDLQTTHNGADHIRGGQPSLGFYDDGKGRIEPAWFTKAELSYKGEQLDALSVVPALRKSSADFVQCETAEKQPVAATVEPVSGQDD